MKPYEVVRKLSSTTGRLDKERILEEAWYAGCRDFFAGANLCYDGLFSFGVKQIQEHRIRNYDQYESFVGFTLLARRLQARHITGNAARDAISMFASQVDEDEWNLFYRRILMKDLDAGISETTLNKVLKKIGGTALQYVIKEFPYQRCCLPKNTDLTKFSWQDGVYSQIKSDGMYVNVNYDFTGNIDMLSRNGKLLPQDQFLLLLQEIKDNFTLSTQTHGELLVYRDGNILPREISNGRINNVIQGGKFESNEYPVYVVWDQIPLSCAVPKGTYTIPYSSRLKTLETQISPNGFIQLVETKVVHSLDDAIEHYKELIGLGFEGTIIKEPTAVWKDGTSKLAVKLKTEVQVDLEVVEFNDGNGKNASTFGSIVCRTSDGLLEVGVSGFKDLSKEGVITRSEIWESREELIGTIMTVKGNGLMKPSVEGGLYSIFLPRFIEFRKDKTVADSLEQVNEQFENAMK